MTPQHLGFRSVVVNYDVLKYSLECIVGPHDNVASHVRRRFQSEDFIWRASGRETAMTFTRLGRAPIIWLPRKPRTAAEHGTLAHEAVHAVRHMLQDHIGMDLTSDSDEAYSFAVGHTVKTILEGLRS